MRRHEVQGLARVVSTHEGPLPGIERGHLFWVDFTDENFARHDPSAMGAEISVGAGGHLRRYSVSPYPQIAGWRIAVETDAPEAGQTVSVHCRLRAGSQPISETWTYEWKS